MRGIPRAAALGLTLAVMIFTVGTIQQPDAEFGACEIVSNVHDQAVIHKSISIERSDGTIRSGNKASEGNKASKENEKGGPEGYIYKGCFKDILEDRAFTSQSSSDGMTTEKCAADCKGSEFFATQYGRECRCGDSKTDFDKHGKAECNQTCTGANEDGEKRGGKFAMSVYQMGKGSANIPVHGARSLDDSSDNHDDRVLTLGSKVVDSMTHEECLAFCSRKNGVTHHMGLEHGTDCFCGSSRHETEVHVYGGANTSAMPCPGGGNSVCVGWLAWSVFNMYDSFVRGVRTEAINNCDMACPGGYNSVCVGPFALSVFKIFDSILRGVRQVAMYERYRVLL